MYRRSRWQALAIASLPKVGQTVWLSSSLFLLLATALQGQAQETLHRRTVQEGLLLDLYVEPLKRPAKSALPLRHGDMVDLRFRIADTTSGAPIRQAHPAAWLDMRAPGEARTPEACVRKLKAFIAEKTETAPSLNLNVYYVLTLNADATLSVVDPLFGFGGSRLLALVQLGSPGYDWALTGDQRRLFVSMPESNKVAVIDTLSWAVLSNIDVAIHPSRVSMQPDDRYLWVASDASGPDAEDSGVTAIATAAVQTATRIVTGPGRHEIAFSGDSRFAFVTNESAGYVSVIDTGTLRKIKDIKTGPAPASVAWSPKAGMVYVSHSSDGLIAAIDPARLEVIARIPTVAPGIGAIRFAPGGRFGFVVHSVKNEVLILDTVTNRIVQIADTRPDPDHVNFSGTLAYIRHRGSDTVLMISLADEPGAGKPVQEIDFPGGQNPPGLMSSYTPADGIVEAPGGGAVLVSNPKDKAVYYYQEGMAAPMGTFDNYGHEPRAVLAVDRRLRETAEPGMYQTSTVLGKPGMYDLVFYLDNPRFVHCFEVPVEPNPDLPDADVRERLDVQFTQAETSIPAGREIHITFRVFDKAAKKYKTGVTDLSVLVWQPPGLWRKRFPAHESPVPGVYQADVALPQAGMFYVHAGSNSLRLGFNDAQPLILHASGEPPSTR